MSALVSESVFLSALQPNTSVTTYALPSDNGSMANETTKTRRVHEQVQMRLAEKSTLPRQNGSASHYAMSDYGGSSTMKYQTYTPSYSSKSSFMNYGSRTMGPRVSHRSGFSCQSAGPDLAFHRVSVGGGSVGGGGGSMYREGMGGYQTTTRPQPPMDSESLAMHTMRQQSYNVNPWMDGSDGGSLVSERDGTLNRQYTQSMEYGTQMRQGGGSAHTMPPMRRSLSGTLSRNVGMGGGEMAEMVQQHSYRGPAHRTISRITNRNRTNMGSQSGSVYGRGGDMPDGFIVSGVSSGSQGNLMTRHGTMSRAMSTRSMQSVGRGADIFTGQMEMGASMGNLSRINFLDMATAVQYLREPDHDLQVLGAAYIQHECFTDKEAKQELGRLKGIGELVKLFTSENQEVQRFATGATRNVIYENMDNKVALIEEGGIQQLMEALKEQDDELHKNITGILWNLSSKDNLKEKLARETLSDLTEKILVPLSGGGESEDIVLSPSEEDILFNTTGCLRNLSSVNIKTRQLIRETKGVVDSLVGYIKSSLEQNKTEDKGMENAVCVLRNLSYHIYDEMPMSSLRRLEGPTRDQATGNSEAIGCFTPMGRKAKNRKNSDLSTFAEVSKSPHDIEWLWNPQILLLYKRVLQQCEINSTTREAAAGAVQNITAGDTRWASVLSRVALEQTNMLPTLLDLLRSNSDLELRSLTGLLRNLSRHCKDKGDMATKVVNNLVTKMPAEGHQKDLSSDVLVNICGTLNNLVMGSFVAARDISYFDGLPKLVAIKTSNDGSPAKEQAAQAAATVLSNMFHYKKLHKRYREKGFTREDFTDGTIY